MADTYKTITNPQARMTIKFLQTTRDTEGKLLEMEASYGPHSIEPPSHYHPYQHENFLVTEGQMTLRIDGKLMILRKGDSLDIPPNTPHSMWNNTSQPATIRWKVAPALTSEYLFESFARLAAEAKARKKRVSKLRTLLILAKHTDVFRLTRPGYFVQKVVFTILKPFASLAGYKAIYE